MPEFILNRTHVLDGKGHKIRFTKGQPTYVPPELIREAIGIGAECLDETVKPFGDDEDEDGKIDPNKMTPEDKEKVFFAAFELLIERNGRDDFGGDGKPAMDALKKLIDFNFVKKERDAAFQKFREQKEAAKD
jgi:hypothetical protein